MRRTLRLGRSAVVLVAVIIVASGVHFLHAFQVKRNAGLLLETAEQAKASGDLPKAAEYYGRYLGFRPDDDGALGEYGLILDRLAKTPRQQFRAFLVLDQAVGRDPDREELRRRAAALAMALGRTKDAKEHLNYLLNRLHKDDAELEDQLGRCLESDARNSGEFQEACDAYEKAAAHDPGRVEAYVRGAFVMRHRLDKPDKADGFMAQLVEKNAGSFEAHLARSRYLRENGRIADAAKELAAARAKGPDEPEVLLAAADLDSAAGRFDDARRALEEGFRSHPDDARFRLGMASLELRARPPRRAEAAAHLREALKALPDRAESVWSVADLFLDAGAPDDAKALLKRLTADGPTPASDYLEARLAFGESKFAAAAALLEQRRQDLAATPDLACRADILLGLCYERLGNPDRRLAAFRRAAEQNPGSDPGRLGQAAALLAAGKPEAALVEYRQLVDRSPEARWTAIRLLARRVLARPPERRTWTEVDALLDGATEVQRDGVDYRLLKAEILAVEGRPDDARALLEDASYEQPQELRYWLARAALADRERPADDAKPAKALEILADAGRELGDVVELRLARAARVSARTPEDAARELRLLESGNDHFSAADRARLLMGLADAYRRAGASRDAVRVCRQARDLSPGDLDVRLRLFDLTLALEDGDADALRPLVDDIRAVEGEDGAAWRYAEAARLTAASRRDDAAGLDKARALIAEAGKRRPSWSRVPLLGARIAERAGDVEAAIEKYQQAIDLGDRRTETVRQAVQLLASRRLFPEAQQVLQKLGDGDATAGDLGRLAAELSLLSGGDKQRALDQAITATPKDSKDYRNYLWLGQVYRTAGEPAKAEDAFRRALALDGAAPETWTALVLLLADAGEKDKAKAELEKARAALAADQEAAVLAPGLEALGEYGQAEEQYLRIRKERPDDAGAARAVAAFYIRRGDLKQAEPLLRRLADSPPRGGEWVSPWARRSLALVLAAGGDYRQSQDSLELLERNLREGNAPEDQRAKALVLAVRPGGRRESIRTLEDSFARMRPTPDEEFLLARLYEADREWARADEHFLNLTAGKNPNPLYLAYYVRALLRNTDADQAKTWLIRLEKVEPAEKSARTLGLKARVLHAKGEDREAARLLADYVDKEFADKKDPAILGETAALLEELGRASEAEALFRLYAAAVEAKEPEKALALGGFLARQNRVAEALDAIEALWPKCPEATAARAAVAAIRAGEATPKDLERVEKRLRDAPRTTDILTAQANLKDAEGRHAEAAELYREVLARAPRHALALNNLAWLLALHEGKPAEALERVDAAVAVAGPADGLLGTRGVVLLKLGRVNDAVQDLEEAVAQRPTAPHYFHLWQARSAAKRATDAEKAALKAEELGLKATDLHVLERDDFERWKAGRQRP
jgi:tetratricopeptide (TPR) repeat protein